MNEIDFFIQHPGFSLVPCVMYVIAGLVPYVTEWLAILHVASKLVKYQLWISVKCEPSKLIYTINHN